jgi:predicted RNA binding protein YcfA (HicA-like mRNA interferase family)
MVFNCRHQHASEASYGRVVKVREVIRLLEEHGWLLVATKGSHRQYNHALKPGRVTVAGKPPDDLAPGTLNSILKQSGLKGRQ